MLELNAAKKKMVQDVRRLERNVAKKLERKVSNPDKERGKNGIFRSGIKSVSRNY